MAKHRYFLAITRGNSYKEILWYKNPNFDQLSLNNTFFSDDDKKYMSKLNNIIDFTQHFNDSNELRTYLINNNLVDEEDLGFNTNIQLLEQSGNITKTISYKLPYKDSIENFYYVTDKSKIDEISVDNLDKRVEDIFDGLHETLSYRFNDELHKSDKLCDELYKLIYSLENYAFYKIGKTKEDDNDLKLKVERLMSSFKIRNLSDESYNDYSKDLSNLITYLSEQYNKPIVEVEDNEMDLSDETYYLKTKILYLSNLMFAHDNRNVSEKANMYYKALLNDYVCRYLNTSLNTKTRYKICMFFTYGKYERDNILENKNSEFEKNSKKLQSYDFGIKYVNLEDELTDEQLMNEVMPFIKDKNDAYDVIENVVKKDGLTEMNRQTAMEELNRILDEDDKGEKNMSITYGIDNITSYLYNDETRKEFYNLCRNYNVPDAAVYFRDKNYMQAAITIIYFAKKHKKFEKELLNIIKKIQLNRIESSMTDTSNDNNKFFQALTKEDKTPMPTTRELSEEEGLDYFTYDEDYNEPDFPPNSEESREYSEENGMHR